MTSEIVINKGDSKTFNVTITNNASVLNITGYTVFFTVKKNTNSDNSTDSDALISKTITSHTSPTLGLTTISLSSTETSINPGAYVYDIQLKDGSGNITSSVADKFIVRGDVTRRTT